MLLKCSNRCDLPSQQLQPLSKSTFTPRAGAACSSYLRHRLNKLDGIYPASGVQSTSSNSWRLASPVPHNRAASTDTMVTPEAPAGNQLQQTDVLIVGGRVARTVHLKVVVLCSPSGSCRAGMSTCTQSSSCMHRASVYSHLANQRSKWQGLGAFMCADQQNMCYTPCIFWHRCHVRPP